MFPYKTDIEKLDFFLTEIEFKSFLEKEITSYKIFQLVSDLEFVGNVGFYNAEFSLGSPKNIKNHFRPQINLSWKCNGLKLEVIKSYSLDSTIVSAVFYLLVFGVISAIFFDSFIFITLFVIFFIVYFIIAKPFYNSNKKLISQEWDKLVMKLKKIENSPTDNTP